MTDLTTDAVTDANALLLDAARTGKTFAIARALVAGADINFADGTGNTALIWAAELNHLSTLQALLKAGADVTPRNKFGQNALLRGLRERADGAVALALIAAGSPVLAADIHKRTPASYAAEQGLVDVFQALMEKDADLTIADKNGWTPLHHAVFNDNRPILARAIASGTAALDQPNSSGMSPLLFAAHVRHVEQAKVLINAGANIDLHDNNGDTLEDLVKARGMEELLPLVAQRRAENLAVIHSGVKSSAMKPVRFRAVTPKT